MGWLDEITDNAAAKAAIRCCAVALAAGLLAALVALGRPPGEKTPPPAAMPTEAEDGDGRAGGETAHEPDTLDDDASALSGMPAADRAGIETSLLDWADGRGLDPSGARTLTSVSGGQGVTAVVLEIDGSVVTATRDGESWSITEGFADVEGATSNNGRGTTYEAESGEVGLTETDRTAPLVGAQCADALPASWNLYARTAGLNDSRNANLLTGTVIADGGRTSFVVASPQPDGGSRNVTVTYHADDGSFGFSEPA